MSKTIEARKLIASALAGKNAYYGQADENAAYPYVVWTLETVSRTDFSDLCEVEMNVVDYGRDTSTVETLCDDIEKIFDHEVFSNSNVYFNAYKENMAPVMVEDRNIIRRRMTFSLNLYEKEAQ